MSVVIFKVNYNKEQSPMVLGYNLDFHCFTFFLLCLFDIHSIMSVPQSICLVITHWFRGG